MKLLLAVDGSPCSEAPVKEVLERPWPQGSRIRVITVMENPRPPPNAFWPEAYIVPEPIYEQVRENAKAVVSRVADSLKARGLDVETRVLTGDPRAAIIEEAKEWGANLILLGSHGYTGLKRWLLGSVAQYVVGHAPCSVEVVRGDAGAPT